MKVIAYIYPKSVRFSLADESGKYLDEGGGTIPHDGSLLSVANAIDTLQAIHNKLELHFSAQMNVLNRRRKDAKIVWN